MTIWGISALSHDASISVVGGDDILFAGHAERYSRKKNDKFLHNLLIGEALKYGEPDSVIWFEKPLSKKLRQLASGEFSEVTSNWPSSYLKKVGINAPIGYVDHHMSHAAGGYFTSGFSDASILVCDAIGEWATTTIWKARGKDFTKVFEQKYPHSIGLFYSAMTHRVGLKPNEEEYILMGMAAYGKPRFVQQIKRDLINVSGAPHFECKRNLHLGCADWLTQDIQTEQDTYDLAASAQVIVEEYLIETSKWMAKNLSSTNLVLAGGVALNCVANSKIAEQKLFDKIWIMPNPGDAGSSLGAIAAWKKEQLNWKSPYLGTDIDRPFRMEHVLEELSINKITAIANGRAEFGPRALGNRSLIADPRGGSIKDKVNDIKRRQRFRPFAPMVLEEHAHSIFDLPVAASPYMQFTAQCKYPTEFPAICHHDGSSRVQTVNEQDNPQIYALLSEFFNRTGCPMLLNTSLNIKGQPLVDDWRDAKAFSKKYGVKVF